MMKKKIIVTNNDIINQFKLLAKQIKLDIDFSSGQTKMANMFRLKSINEVINILEKINFPITSAEQLKGIKYIGKGSLQRIEEILKTGKLSEIKLTTQNDAYLKYLNEMENIYGIGSKTAYDLFTKYNIKSIKELQEAVNKKIVTLPENILKGLKYVDKIKTNIPRAEIDEVNNYLLKVLMKIDPELFGIICGSYRRLKATSNDIDFIIVHPKIIKKKDTVKINYMKLFIEKLRRDKFLIDSFTGDDVPTKFMGIYQWKNGPYRRIDIRYFPHESYYAAILYFTGSGDFNRRMRQVAISLGYKLNEYGLFDENGKMFKVKSEKDIFDLLGMEYVSPEKRY